MKTAEMTGSGFKVRGRRARCLRPPTCLGQGQVTCQGRVIRLRVGQALDLKLNIFSSYIHNS